MTLADIDRMARPLLATVGDAAVRGVVVASIMGLALVMLRRKRAAGFSRPNNSKPFVADFRRLCELS